MRSTFAGLNTMYRGIVSNQASLETVGHNITNAGTDGYSRQKVNQAATSAQTIYTTFGPSQMGTGNDVLSIMRARNVYADKQYWKENATNSYYEMKQVNYDKLEAIFNDTDDTGIMSSVEAFYKSWVDLSANASTTSNRVTVIEMAKTVIDRINTGARQVQDQIDAEYEDMKINVNSINDLTDQIVTLNKNIAAVEATGSYANDLRDKRDLLTDELSTYFNVSVTEDKETGAYTIVSNGVSVVSGFSCLHFEMADRVMNRRYGIADYTLKIKETQSAFLPADGILLAKMENVGECKNYLDDLSNMAAFLMTNFNDQHRLGYGIGGSDIDPEITNINFFGDKDKYYYWDPDQERVLALTKNVGGEAETYDDKIGIEVIKMLSVNKQLTERDGTNYVSAATGKYIVQINPDTDQPIIDPNTGKPADVVVETYTNILKEVDPNTGQLIIIYKVDPNTGNIEKDPNTGKPIPETIAGFDTREEAEAGVKGLPAGTPELGKYDVAYDATTEQTTITTEVVTIKYNKATKKWDRTVTTSTAIREKDAGTADGTNAVDVSTLFNQVQGKCTDTKSIRPIGSISLEAYYNASMSGLGASAEAMDNLVEAQGIIMLQVENWRSSTAGVNWNEELTNMITFQTGYAACSRCLTTMDEMLDRLINNTGVVGR